jgi:hypothetical protein
MVNHISYFGTHAALRLAKNAASPSLPSGDARCCANACAVAVMSAASISRPATRCIIALLAAIPVGELSPNMVRNLRAQASSSVESETTCAVSEKCAKGRGKKYQNKNYV